MGTERTKTVDGHLIDAEYNVVILGAGVSFNYDFPLGKTLVEKIIDNLPKTTGDTVSEKVHSAFHKTMCAYTGVNRDFNFLSHAVKLRSYLAENPINSIDSYINTFIDKDNDSQQKKESNKIYSFILKGLIITILSQHESGTKESILDKSKFYGFFYKNYIMNKSIEELQKLKIINFNYDRSFDCAMDYWLARKNLDPDQTHALNAKGTIPAGFVRLSNELEIIRPYGWIDDKDYFAYGKIPAHTELKIMIDKSHIKVISTDRSSDGFVRAAEVLTKSNHVIFLGFGFDQQNLTNLGYPNMKKYVPNPWFTAIQEGQSRIQIISDQITDNADRKNAAINSRKKSLIDFFDDNVIKL